MMSTTTPTIQHLTTTQATMGKKRRLKEQKRKKEKEKKSEIPLRLVAISISRQKIFNFCVSCRSLPFILIKRWVDFLLFFEFSFILTSMKDDDDDDGANQKKKQVKKNEDRKLFLPKSAEQINKLFKKREGRTTNFYFTFDNIRLSHQFILRFNWIQFNL